MTAAPEHAAGTVSELRSDDAAFDISDEADVSALLRAEEAHFWHRARNRFILRKIAALGAVPGARILELGCGAGCVAAELAKAGYEVTGVDGHRALLAVACTRAPKARFLCHDLRQGPPDVERGSFDVVGLFDVIEHLDDPVQALADAMCFAKPGGYVIGTVPALMSLWSSIDAHSGHKTRYSERTLGTTLSALRGARVIEIAPFFRLLVPLLWAQRRLIDKSGHSDPSEHSAAAVSNMRVPPFPINASLLALSTAEQALTPALSRFPLPGASLWFALEAES